MSVCVCVCVQWQISNLCVVREGYGGEEGEHDEGKILGLFDDDSFRFQ